MIEPRISQWVVFWNNRARNESIPVKVSQIDVIEKKPTFICMHCNSNEVHQLNSPGTSACSCVKNKNTIIRRAGH